MTAILTLGLAIGVNTAVFSVVDAVLLKPLPYPQSDQLALVSRVERLQGNEGRSTSVDGTTWQLIRDHVPSAESAVFSTWTSGVNLVAPGPGGVQQARYVRQQRVGANFFTALRVPPLAGRDFTADEDAAGGPQATILSASLWRSLFNADPAIIGTAIMLRGSPYVVVGIMPDGFQSGEPADLWTTLRATTTGEGGGENYQVFLRLRNNAAWAEADTELTQVGEQLRAVRPAKDERQISFATMPLRQGLTAALREPLLVLWAAVGSRVAHRLRQSRRSPAREIVSAGSRDRHAHGARQRPRRGRPSAARREHRGRPPWVRSRPRYRRAGARRPDLARARCLRDLAAGRPRCPQHRRGHHPVAPGQRAFGMAPALQASRLDVQAGLNLRGTRGVAGASARSPRRLIVVAQVALGVTLLVGAGLLLRTFTHLRGLSAGFTPAGLVTAAVSLEDNRYRTADRVNQLFDADAHPASADARRRFRRGRPRSALPAAAQHGIPLPRRPGSHPSGRDREYHLRHAGILRGASDSCSPRPQFRRDRQHGRNTSHRRQRRLRARPTTTAPIPSAAASGSPAPPARSSASSAMSRSDRAGDRTDRSMPCRSSTYRSRRPTTRF